MDNKLILDELFGSDRNVLKKDKVARNYWDEEVFIIIWGGRGSLRFASTIWYRCVSMICGSTPSTTPRGSKNLDYPIGRCKKRHDQHFLRDFQADKS